MGIVGMFVWHEDRVGKKRENVSNDIGEEDEKQIDLQLYQLSDGKQSFYKAMKYHSGQPNHFLIHINTDNALEKCWYRNVNTDKFQDRSGEVKLEYKMMIYVADVVLDKYIREYGGENKEYDVDEIVGTLPEDAAGLSTYRIYGDDVNIEVTFSYYKNGLASVLIEDTAEMEVRQSEFIAYSKYGIDCSNKNRNSEEYQSWLIVNRQAFSKVQKFRNVVPNNIDSAVDEFGYYIADQVLDQYIRNYGGNDTIYNVKLLHRVRDEKTKDYTYTMQLQSDEDILEVVYSENSWEVYVERQSGDMDLGVVSQEEIEWIGQLSNIRSLSMGIDDDDIDLSPIAELRELEELHIMVHSESKELDLAFVSKLTQLKKFYLYRGSGQWTYLSGLKQLEELEIIDSEVKNLSFLKELTQLKEVSLSMVSDSDIEYLKKLKELVSLYLEGYNIRNIRCLNEMKNLTYIYLAEMESSPENKESIPVDAFCKMDMLSQVYLIRMNFKDMTPISLLPNVEKLVLVETGIESIRCLEKLPKLRELEIYGEDNEQVKNEAVKYFFDIETIVVEEEIPDIYK